MAGISLKPPFSFLFETKGSLISCDIWFSINNFMPYFDDEKKCSIYILVLVEIVLTILEGAGITAVVTIVLALIDTVAVVVVF